MFLFTGQDAAAVVTSLGALGIRFWGCDDVRRRLSVSILDMAVVLVAIGVFGARSSACDVFRSCKGRSARVGRRGHDRHR